MDGLLAGSGRSVRFNPGLIRLDVSGFSPWYTYLMLWVMVAWLRNARALVVGTLILCHWAAAETLAAGRGQMGWLAA